VIEHLAIACGLNVNSPEWRRVRELAFTNGGTAATIEAVADLTFLFEQCCSGREVSGIAQGLVRALSAAGTLSCNNHVATATSPGSGAVRALDKPGTTKRAISSAATAMITTNATKPAATILRSAIGSPYPENYQMRALTDAEAGRNRPDGATYDDA